jgi:hypothetical protein
LQITRDVPRHQIPERPTLLYNDSRAKRREQAIVLVTAVLNLDTASRPFGMRHAALSDRLIGD